MRSVSRRQFVKVGALAAGALPLRQLAASQPMEESFKPSPEPVPGPVSSHRAQLRWLEGGIPRVRPGTTWGVSWPEGIHPPGTPFGLRDPMGGELPLQSWPTAYWPDGSLKWTAHALPAEAGSAETLELVAGANPAAAGRPVVVRTRPDGIEIDIGVMTVRIPRSGNALIESLVRDGREIARDGRLVALAEGDPDESGKVGQEASESVLSRTVVEQDGPVRAVVKLEGSHRLVQGDRTWLPFVVRLYFYAGAASIRLVHSFVYDGDEHRDFIRGLGIRFSVPLTDEPHDRHIRFAGEGDGLFGEAVRGLTGLRRDPGAAVREAQVAGLPTGPVEDFDPRVGNRLHLIPAWGDFTLAQLSADGFQIRKRTKAGHGWIPAGAGRRASGLAYIGGISGGLSLGMKDFWQRHPTQLDIRNADTGEARLTLWLWAPDAPPMDLRFYHDGMGMETHRDELEGLEITYEDYEEGFGTPHGKARTSELMLWVHDATPAREQFAAMAETVRTPPLLAAAPEHLHACVVFGPWSLPDRGHPLKARIETMHDRLLASWMNQVEQHRWYGFWDYGDFMHSYDPDRKVWRYDVGGFAWANSELSPDLWLWYAYLRSGRADVFRLAEAMTRHTGEVDVYHLGRFKGLGTRHNVQHWGCSAKQVRISTAAYRRIYYFLTADERVGDLMRDLVDSDHAFTRLDPIRKIRRGPPPSTDPERLSIGLGTDWGSLAAAWLAEWERTGDTIIRDKLVSSMRTIGALPHGFFTRDSTFNAHSGAFTPAGEPGIGVSHLSAVFGLVEIAAELIDLVDDEGFERAWVEYCELFNASGSEQEARLGRSLGRLNLGQAHSRLTAYAGRRRDDARLLRRAWEEFLGAAAGLPLRERAAFNRQEGPAVLNPVEETPWMSCNASSQWGLAAIQVLALAGDHAPEGRQ
ncbi:MAG: Tat pathway signal sequence domain protein [Puniceicoccaceae bacterium]|nr:MAG: Tat pathway signal sequence domain protein [Puniceicoccaceae bacterium]